MGRSSGNACEYIDLTAKSTSARSSFLLGILGPEPRLTASFSQTPPFLTSPPTERLHVFQID